MGSVFVSRAEYNRLVDRYPAWMQSVWPKLVQFWGMAGVFVNGSAGSGLKERLAAVQEK